MNAIVEFSLIFESFRNIDLYQNGLYALRTSISQKSSNRQACPYRHMKLERDSHSDLPLQDSWVCSKSFPVQFFDEQVALREVVLFRIESVPYQDFTLSIDLLFTPSKDQTFKILSTANYSLPFPTNFNQSYIPVIFENNYCSLVNLSLHYLFIEYKFPANDTIGSATAHFFTRKGKVKRFIGAAETDEVHKKLSTPLIDTYRALRDAYVTIIRKSHCKDKFVKIDCPVNLKVSTEIFSERVACHNPELVTAAILQDISSFSARLLQAWHKLTYLVIRIPKAVRLILQEKYYKSNCKRLRSGIIALEKPGDREHYKSLATMRRKENAEVGQLSGIDKRFSLNPLVQPIILEEVLLLGAEVEAPKNSRGVHLFVMVHGLQGSPNDMRLVKNQISVFNANSVFLLSSANEQNTDSSIELLGLKLSLEVIYFINDNLNEVERISFIGHSLGGLVIRAALPHLQTYANKMHLILTFGTPHLGVNNSSKLVNAGLWILKTISDAPSLKQLTLTDSEKYLVKLSCYKGLEWFKYCAVFSSPQDFYVPFHSARIEVVDNGASCEMASSILANLKTIYRFTVDFKIKNRIVDSYIGRAAHINFLEDSLVINMIILIHPEFFY